MRGGLNLKAGVLVGRPEIHRLGHAKRVGYRSPCRGGNNKTTAVVLTGAPHREAPLTRRGRGKDLREGPVGELRDLRRRSESGPGGQPGDPRTRRSPTPL